MAQGGCERRSEVIVKMHKWGWGVWGSGLVGDGVSRGVGLVEGEGVGW